MAGERSVDTDRPADEAWILSVQSKLYQWSKANPNDTWRDMWGWMTNLRMLRAAWRRVALNKGKRTAGIDGMTVGRIRAKVGEQRFLEELQPSCALAHIVPALHDASSSPRPENQVNSDPWVFRRPWHNAPHTVCVGDFEWR